MLIDYLPPFMQEIREIKKIMEINEPYIKDIEVEKENILKNMFVLEADESGIKHYEIIFEIEPKLTDSLEKRRTDILAIYNQTLPFTIKNLELMLNVLCGEDGYNLKIIYEKFILYIRLSLKNKEIEKNIFQILEKIVPVNMTIKIEIDYNIWEDLKAHTWETLNKYTWEALKESEEIKNGR